MTGAGKKLDISLMFRRAGSSIVDGAIELSGGLLGSYFGVMVAALLVAVQNEPAEQLQHSMWNGMGFGFVFWSLSISFINRVLIQGLSRASLGKKLFKLELISSGQPLTWNTMMTRWVMSYASIAMGGLGYAYLFFNRDARAFHDVIAQTDVVPAYAGINMTVEYSEESHAIPMTMQVASRILILSNTTAERPMAEVIQLPVRTALPEVTIAAVLEKTGTGDGSIADVIELHPKDEADKKAA